MQHYAFPQTAFVSREEMRSSVSVVPMSELKDSVACPKPRHLTLASATVDHPVRPLRWLLSHQTELYDSKPGSDLLEFLLTKGGCGVEQSCNPVAWSPSFLCGSPPSRVSNPLIKDPRFRDDEPSPSRAISPLPAVSSPARKVSCVRGSFRSNPVVRVEGFDFVDRDTRNCSVPALA